ncbi:MAG: hypothetical protein V4667_05205 [Bacteroidota bacterium]
MIRESDNSESESHQWTAIFLRDQFQKESDRAAVILTASLLDEALTSLIRSFLVPCSSAKDTIFEEVNSPLANFSSKIDMANRLGLISNKLTRDIHLIRKIRNSFAHDVFGCDFENGSVKGRVLELKKSMMYANHTLKSEEMALLYPGTRGEFLLCTFFILWHLNNLIEDNTHLKEAKEEDFLYKILDK